MDLRKVMYVVIIIICIVSIGVGVYSQLTDTTRTINRINNIGAEEEYTGKTQEELKREFYNIFDNQMHVGQYDTSNIPKNDSSKEIVYTAYALTEEKDNYNMDIYLPVININSEDANKFNNITQEIFANKANEILSGTTVNTIYTISYTGYINGDIMSVIIESTLKEGSTAQRAIVQTYNYNLKTGKEITIQEAIEQRGVSIDEVSEKINLQIQEAIRQSNDIQVTGYSVYKRDIENEMYKVENTSTFYLGGDGSLNIIYAYGNNEFTSEMDIIVI